MPVPDIRADRTLILPGPIAPLSHLGATLLRYTLHASLRYALYQLGQAPPESPPTRFVSLRLYLDGPALSKCLGTAPSGRQILAAVLDPGGIQTESLPTRVGAAIWFHRQRLRLKVPRVRSPSLTRIGSVAALRETLSELLPALGEALLGEILASVERRKARAAGRQIEPAQSQMAHRFLTHAEADLERLGPADPREPSWQDKLPTLDRTSDAIRALAQPPHPKRGSFREIYRATLDRLRPLLLAVAEHAVARGHLATEDDIFFLPFDLLEDLEADDPPHWLEDAIASNRSEWIECAGRPAPADTLGNVEPAPRSGLVAELAPLALLA